MVVTVFSMVFTSSVELAFRSRCDFEGLVEQSMVFTVFSMAQSSWPFEVTAILKAQSSKAWYVQVSSLSVSALQLGVERRT